MSNQKKKTTALEAHRLVKNYHDGTRTLKVLKGLDFRLEAGETVAITGPSGTGKSTLLNLLALLDRPTEGQVLLEGTELTKMSTSQINRMRLRHMGLVFQSHYLLQEFCAWENVAMPSLIARKNRADAQMRAMELMERVGLVDRAEHVPSKLSGGERQRVALARALMNDPAVVLADEPTGNLDLKTGESVVKLLWEATSGQGRSLVIVTHEMDIAAHADRLLHLENGVLREI
ncbi:MAG: ABC transporter ATP-binding protein [Candidatus Sumerlaeota bacterium]